MRTRSRRTGSSGDAAVTGAATAGLVAGVKLATPAMVKLPGCCCQTCNCCPAAGNEGYAAAGHCGQRWGATPSLLRRPCLIKVQHVLWSDTAFKLSLQPGRPGWAGGGWP
jgi:hypothetical protein